MWLLIKYYLSKMRNSFRDWRYRKNISLLKIISTSFIVLFCIVFTLGVFGMINSCLNDNQKRQKIEAKEQVVKQKVSSSDYIRRGDKVKVTIQTNGGPQSFEGVFVGRCDSTIGIKTDKGKVAFGGPFVVEEIK